METRDRIKARRLELGMTLEELGNKIGVKKATIQRYESGKIKNLKRKTIMQIAKALETTPAYLMGWAEENECATLEGDALDKENLELFKCLPDDKKQQVLDFLRFLKSSGDSD